MRINRVIVPPEVAEKIERKHNVQDWEAQEIFFNEDAFLYTRRSQRVRDDILPTGVHILGVTSPLLTFINIGAWQKSFRREI